MTVMQQRPCFNEVAARRGCRVEGLGFRGLGFRGLRCRVEGVSFGGGGLVRA